MASLDSMPKDSKPSPYTLSPLKRYIVAEHVRITVLSRPAVIRCLADDLYQRLSPDSGFAFTNPENAGTITVTHVIAASPKGRKQHRPWYCEHLSSKPSTPATSSEKRSAGTACTGSVHKASTGPQWINITKLEADRGPSNATNLIHHNVPLPKYDSASTLFILSIFSISKHPRYPYLSKLSIME
ncbi:hypothetical protein BJV82DRAFT_580284 [Fennellomyces sp. T-0311]|nr:hypothetical protein BJV82DRAFT_580284 [Fennellomyces sp. T-0311]